MQKQGTTINIIKQFQSPVNPLDSGHKLNVYQTFKRHPWRLLNVLCTFNSRPAMKGSLTRNFKPLAFRFIHFHKWKTVLCFKSRTVFNVEHLSRNLNITKEFKSKIFPKAVGWRCSAKRLFWKFHKIHRKRRVSEFLF